ncbi:hypothetical protein [Mycobacterium sp. NPDC050853]|uniref:hypothetical protein n=1 Tax=Mycobacterium sp. NPDC050853 TaxID=3155160 RepID=UPI0033FFF4A6
MSSELDPAAIWRVLPKSLQSELRKHRSEPLTDQLLVQCHQVAEKHNITVFWRPDAAASFTRHRLHPALVEYLAHH